MLRLLNLFTLTLFLAKNRGDSQAGKRSQQARDRIKRMRNR